MPRLPIYHALSHQRASTDDRFAKGSVENGRCNFAGPLRSKDMALVFWDQYARYPFVKFTSSTFADYVIPLFTRVFNTYGIPEEIKLGNGTPFNGSKFANFAQEQRFRHRKDTPEWAEAHNDVKRFMQTLKKSARTSKLEGEAIQEGVQRTVGSYRATPAQRQRKALISSCSAESYGGSYRKGSYPQEKFHRTQSDKETRLKRNR